MEGGLILPLLVVLLLQHGAVRTHASSQSLDHRDMRASGSHSATLGYIPELSRALLDRSKATLGDETRMRSFVSKLVGGQHVKYAILGSRWGSGQLIEGICAPGDQYTALRCPCL